MPWFSVKIVSRRSDFTLWGIPRLCGLCHTRSLSNAHNQMSLSTVCNYMMQFTQQMGGGSSVHLSQAHQNCSNSHHACLLKGNISVQILSCYRLNFTAKITKQKWLARIH